MVQFVHSGSNYPRPIKMACGGTMADIRNFMKEKEKREQKQSDYMKKIRQHKLTSMYRLLLIAIAAIALIRAPEGGGARRRPAPVRAAGRGGYPVPGRGAGGHRAAGGEAGSVTLKLLTANHGAGQRV